MSKAYCPTPNAPEFQELAEVVGVDSAHVIYRDAGDRFPTGDELRAYIEREQSQEKLDTNLSDSSEIADIINKFENPLVEKLPNEEGYVNKKTGELVNQRVSMLVEEYYRQQGIIFKDDQNRFYAKKGTVVHEYMRHILDSQIANTPLTLTQAQQKVLQLKETSEEFKDDKDSFFNLTEPQFNQLQQAASELVAEIKKLQKNIDPKGEVKFYTEIPVIDEHRDIAGTIDFLAVFSDGSASMYDFKTFKDFRKTGPSSLKIGAWDVQLSNYRNMLKHTYGISKFRQVRVIPINTDYSMKKGKEWVNQIEEGFRLLSIKTKQNNLEYLDPIPFQEEPGDRNYNDMIVKLYKRRNSLDILIQNEHNVSKRINLTRRRSRLDKVLKDLQLGKDIGSLFSHLRQMVKVTKSKLHLTREHEDFLNAGELVEMINELQMYSDLSISFKEKLKDFDKEKGEQLKQQVAAAEDYIKDIIEDLTAELLDRQPDDILQPGTLPGNQLSRILYGVGNFDVPIFKEFTKLWRGANNMVMNTTMRDIDKIQKVDKAFSEWASANGYSQQDKFKLLLNEEKHLHSKFNREFWTKRRELRKKAQKEELTAEDKQWIRENLAVDKPEAEKYVANAHADMKYQLETGEITKQQYDTAKAKFDKYLNPLLSTSAAFTGKTFWLLRPKKDLNNYISPEWQFIQKHKPLKDYYDMYVEYNKSFAEILGKDKIFENFVAHVEQGVTDNLLEHGSKNLREAIIKKYEVRQNDAIRGVTDEKGNSLPSIPILYINPLRHSLSDKKKQAIENQVALKYPRGSKEFKDEVEQLSKEKSYEIGLEAKSTDLTKSLMLFAQSVNEFKYMSEIEPMIKGLKHLVDMEMLQQKAVDASGKTIVNKMTDTVVTKFGWDADLQKTFNTFVNRLIYKQKYTSEAFSSEKYSSNKVIEGLMQWLSVRALGFNYVISAANFLQGKFATRMAASEGQFFQKEHLKGALKAYARHDEQYYNVIEHFLPQTRDMVRERIELSGASFASRRLRSRTFFLGHIKGDDQVDFTIATSMAKYYRVDSDGKIKNPKYDKLIKEDAPTVFESIKVNENDETYIPGLAREEYDKFRAKIQKVGFKAKGMMSEEQKGIYASSIYGTMFMQFRTWSVGLAEARFGGMKYDPTLETFDIGRFNAALGGIMKHGVSNALKEGMGLMTEVALMGLYKRTPNMERIRYKYDQFIEQNPQYRNKFTIEQFIQLQKDKMRGFLAEARIYLSLVVVAQLLAGLGWDDEEETPLLAYNGTQIAKRALLEVSFWFNPRSVDEIVRSPLPLWGLFRELTRIIDSSVRETTYIIEGERPSQVKTSPGYYVLKSTPGVNQVLDFFRYFHQYNPPKTGLDHVLDMFKDDEKDKPKN